jgi:catechol 2,3-dioxygenase-like lactoylglutathione lyase family enzyme
MAADILINIDVDDLDRATAFYTAAFGLQVGRRFAAFAIELTGGTSPIYLLAKAAGNRRRPGPHDRGAPTLCAALDSGASRLRRARP